MLEIRWDLILYLIFMLISVIILFPLFRNQRIDKECLIALIGLVSAIFAMIKRFRDKKTDKIKSKRGKKHGRS